MKQPVLFSNPPSHSEVSHHLIAEHNARLPLQKHNPYRIELDSAVLTSDIRAEALLRLRSLLYQQSKRCLKNKNERKCFVSLLYREINLKKTLSDPVQLVRGALLDFHKPSL